VQASTSTRYKQALLEAPAHIASKILAIEQRVKQRFTTIITDKTEYYMHIPHSVVCIFAQYMGFSVEECKRALRECFLEYDNITDKMKNADSISVFYFSRDSVVSQQLYQIANGNLNLQDCPEAFVEMQERAFASNVARYIEAEHKKTKHAIQRGLRTCKPAYGCARQRCGQIISALEKPDEMDFVVSHWNASHTMWVDLLSHLVPKHEIHSLSTAERHARAYQYHKLDHFKDCSKIHEYLLEITKWKSYKLSPEQSESSEPTPTLLKLRKRIVHQCFKAILLCSTLQGL
jgi:hypothetical protein